MIFPLCSPFHPIFGPRNCEIYTFQYFYDSPRFTYEKTFNLPEFSQRTFTDIYTHKTIYDTIDYQTVGVSFSSPNLILNAYTERLINIENYAYAIIGRFLGFTGYVFKGSRGGYNERGYFASYDGDWFNVSVGWDGGLSAGASVGKDIYLKGMYYTSLDTLMGAGAGIKGGNYDLWFVGGKGIMGNLYMFYRNFDFEASYLRSGLLNSGYAELSYMQRLGVAFVFGKRPYMKDSILESPEIQGLLGYKFKWMVFKIFGIYDWEGRYRVRGKMGFRFGFRDIVVLYPNLDAYYEQDGDLWVSIGGNLIFYEDLSVGAFYDEWKGNRTVRIDVRWRLWD